MFLKLILITTLSILTLCLISRYFQDQKKRGNLIRIPGTDQWELWDMIQIAGPKQLADYFEDVTKVYNGHGRELQ